MSYLSREIEADGKVYNYRRIKEDIIMDTTGILCNRDNVNIADRQLIERILPAYKSAALEKRVLKLCNTLEARGH